MSGMTGWIVAVIAIIVAGFFYFWPQLSQAPGMQQEGTTEQSQDQGTRLRSPVGIWQSTTGEKFTREIRADGVITDRYEGDTSAGINGQWKIVSTDESAGPMVIEVSWENGVETTSFVVNSLDDDSMTTTELTGQQLVTTFVRI
jgi:hypothetical protein